MTRPPFAAVRAAATPQLSEREYRAQRIADEIALEALNLIGSAFLGECTRREAAHELLRAASFAAHPQLADRKAVISRACRMAWDEAEERFSDAFIIIAAEVENACANGAPDIDATAVAMELAEDFCVHWRLVLPMVQRIAHEQRLVRDGLRRLRHA